MTASALDKQAQAELTAARMRNCTNQALDGLEKILKLDTEDRAKQTLTKAFILERLNRPTAERSRGRDAMSKVGPDRPKRAKTGGRQKGTPNKVTTIAKEAVALAFDKLGGTDALVLWANTNDETRKAFYTQVWPKIIPLQLNGAGEDGEHLHSLTVKFVGAGR